jgi:hypothetical protein
MFKRGARPARQRDRSQGFRPLGDDSDTPMMRCHLGVRRGAFSVRFSAPFEVQKRPLFGRGSGCFDTLKPVPACCQVPSFAYKAEGEQRGTVGMTFRKISRIYEGL